MLPRTGFQPKVVMRSDSAEATKAGVKSRLGVAMLFLYNANQDVRDKSIRVIRVERSLSARMVLIKRRSTFTPRPSLAFAQLAQQMRWANLHLIGSPETS